MYEFIYLFIRLLASFFALVIWVVVRLFPGFVSCRKFSI